MQFTCLGALYVDLEHLLVLFYFVVVVVAFLTQLLEHFK